MTERGRRTLREQMLRNQKTENLYAALSGKPARELPIPAEPKKRAPAQPSGEPSEAEILRAIIQLLKRHPKVAMSWRQNSGTFQERNRDGTTRYIRANTARGMSDIMGTLKDGRTLAIEVKSRTGRMRPGQEEFLASDPRCGRRGRGLPQCRRRAETAGGRMKLDFNALAQRLLLGSETLVPQWLPGGRRRGHEWVCGDLSGGEGTSLSVNLLSGRWADFATSDRGGDLIDLYAAIHELTMAEAYRELDDGSAAAAPARPAKPAKPPRTVVTPVPEAAADCECVHPAYGAPSARWTYWDGNGEVLGYVARYDPPGQRKQIVPWTWDGDRWGMGQWPVPRPLYRLQELEARAADPVLIVEGEKAADAAAAISGPYVVCTWPGGGQAVNRANWKPVHGRKVLLWPDADDAGIADNAAPGSDAGRAVPRGQDHRSGRDARRVGRCGQRVHQLAGRTGLDRPAHQRVRAAAGAGAAETDGAGTGGARRTRA
jgi:hypothetical protein